MENSQENTTFILADVKVFDFLKEKAGDRKTKTEAYLGLAGQINGRFCFSICKKIGAKTSSQPMSCDNLRFLQNSGIGIVPLSEPFWMLWNLSGYLNAQNLIKASSSP